MSAALASLAAGWVMVAAPASADTTPLATVRVQPTARLMLQGLSATLRVTVACTDGASAYLTGSLRQPAGQRRIAIAYGILNSISCDGIPHVLSLQMRDPTLTFRAGRATAEAGLHVEDPSSGVWSQTKTGLRLVTLRWHF